MSIRTPDRRLLTVSVPEPDRRWLTEPDRRWLTSRREPARGRSGESVRAPASHRSNVTAALADRLSRNRTVDLEARHDFAPDRLTEKSLDIGEKSVLVDAHERHGVALHACATRAADPVDVVLGNRW